MKLKVPISLGDKHGSETDYRDNLLVNYTLVSRDIKGDQGYIISHPGLSSFGSAFGIDRGGIFNDRQNSHLRVSGERLLSVDSQGVSTEIGLISGNDHAILPYSFQTQGILADNKFWVYDGATLTQVVDPDLGAPIDCIWINGLYFFTDGETLYHTTAASETSIEPLTFATSEFSPDRTYALIKNQQNQVVVLNRYSTEWFSDTGAPTGFRFARIPGKALKVGVVGTNCKVEIDGRIFILGGRKEEAPSVHAISGGAEQTIATREVDKIIAQYTENQLQAVVMEARVEERDKFIILRLPNETLLYNLTIGNKYGNKYAWTIIKSSVNEDSIWRGRNGVFDPRISKWIYGDSEDSRLGYLDNTINSQYDEQQENIFYSPIIKLEGASINEFEIETIPGFSGDRIVTLMSLSFDGVTHGMEYAFIESNKYDYNTRFIGRNLGYIRDNVSFKFRTVSTGRTAFTGMVIDYD